MKLNLRTLQIRETAGLHTDVERQLEPLQDIVSIGAAHVLLGKYRDRNPPFFAAVHLEVPGPDLHAFAHDHTIDAALLQVQKSLREQISLRLSRRLQNRKNRRKMRPVPQCNR
jgi:ribosome-associated translation inhibitor RaiA